MAAGAVSLALATPIGAAVYGNDQFNVNGSGSLSFYGPAGTLIAVSGDWTSYSATVSGPLSITLTTDGLMVDGTALPAGAYTITAASVAMGGSGPSRPPNFTGSVSITAKNDTVNLGPWTGSLAAGAGPLDPSNVATMDGYSGTITVKANGDGTDAVSFNGAAGNILQVSASPPTLTTDQNTPVTFAAKVLTTLADTYSFTVNAPEGWNVSMDGSGNVTATPAPGLQGGTYPIQVIATSQTDPDLIAQSIVYVNINPTQPGLKLTVASDPLFTVPFNGAELPSAFRATIQDLGPAADTYNLTFSNVPSGFSVEQSSTSVTVPAGATGFDGIYLVPNAGQPLPAPGTVVSFTVRATSTTNPAITQTQTASFTVPDIDAVSLTSAPTSLSSTPGTPATATLTLQNNGNVSETVTLATTTPSGLTAGSLSPVTIAPGASQTETLTLTPAASAPLNQTLTATITATYGPSGSPLTAGASVDILVRSAQTVAVSQASIAANSANNPQLSAILSDLADTLASLQTTTSAALFTEAQTDLGNVKTLLAIDPALASFASQVPPLITDAQSADLTDLLANVTSLFKSISSVLDQEAAEQFTASLTPDEADIQPGQSQTFSLQLTDTGPDVETLSLSVGALARGRDGPARPEHGLAGGRRDHFGERRRSARRFNRPRSSHST